MATNLIEFEGAVKDGDFISPRLPSWTRKGMIAQTFFSDAEMKVPVYPSAGTVTYTGSEDGFNYGVLDDSQVDPTTGNYKRASWQLGALSTVKATMAGIAGATHFKIYVLVSD